MFSLHVQILYKSVTGGLIPEECNTDAFYYADLFVLSSQFRTQPIMCFWGGTVRLTDRWRFKLEHVGALMCQVCLWLTELWDCVSCLSVITVCHCSTCCLVLHEVFWRSAADGEHRPPRTQMETASAHLKVKLIQQVKQPNCKI